MEYGSPADTIDRLRKENADLTQQLSNALAQLQEEHETPCGPLIHRKIIEVMKRVSHVGKNDFNEQQKYPFRGIDGVLNAVGPAMREVGVFAVPRVVESSVARVLSTTDKAMRESTVRIEYTFYAEDGSSITAVVPGESLDTGDKGMAKALSVAFRIVLIQIFALPTQEPTTDHDGHYHEESRSALSPWVRNRGLELIETGEAPELIEFWVEAIAYLGVGNDPVSRGVDQPIWAYAIGRRILALIAESWNDDFLRELWGWLRDAELNPEIDGHPLAWHLRQRVMELKAGRQKNFDDFMGLITGAGPSEAEAALRGALDYAESGALTGDQYNQLNQVYEDRVSKLEDARRQQEEANNVPE